ncbi:uncharacterized protein LOC132719582 [Ruditapes philippinarum]|uniref:uncharacterized protein LOC132719582 n=1 Tax=Ruditapes philippinarum TaxID=129788 RepID=UPI00295B22F7|nr:uncharacterized protein LOC132719582 [Ruditapes philippinarum]XP_060559356.1 uncharacterized protein LOC132719582 [Ruditapes philippinarum]
MMNNGSTENGSMDIEGELFRNYFHWVQNSSEDGMAQISCISEPVTVVVVIGQYRTGKSYLMNRLANVANEKKEILKMDELKYTANLFRETRLRNRVGIQQECDQFGNRSNFMIDDFYKGVLNRSLTRFVEDLDTTTILDLLLERDFLTDRQVTDIKELSLTSTRTKKILSQVALRGAEGYRIFKQLLRESKQERLAEYLGRQELDLKINLMTENEDKRKQVRLQTAAANIKANTDGCKQTYLIPYTPWMQQEIKECIEWEQFFTSWREQHIGSFGKYLFWPDLRKDLTGKRKNEDNYSGSENNTTQHVIIMTKTEAMKDSGKHSILASDKTASDSIHDTEEFRELEQMLKCKVCLDADLCTVFLPCRHMAVCERCADVLEHCPVCRATIENSIELNFE